MRHLTDINCNEKMNLILAAWIVPTLEKIGMALVAWLVPALEKINLGSEPLRPILLLIASTAAVHKGSDPDNGLQPDLPTLTWG